MSDSTKKRLSFPDRLLRGRLRRWSKRLGGGKMDLDRTDNDHHTKRLTEKRGEGPAGTIVNTGSEGCPKPIRNQNTGGGR